VRGIAILSPGSVFVLPIEWRDIGRAQIVQSVRLGITVLDATGDALAAASAVAMERASLDATRMGRVRVTSVMPD